MTKNEYIEKYGIEKYEAKLRYYAEYRKKNKSKLKNYFKTRWETVKNDVNLQRKVKYQNDEEYRNMMKTKSKEYQHTHRGKSRRTTPEQRAKRLLADYKIDDKNKNRQFNLTFDWIMSNIFGGQSCVYCGETSWNLLGCDRIDNNKGHTTDNCVCSCGKCNVKRKKQNYYSFRYGVKDWGELMKQLCCFNAIRSNCLMT